MTYRRMRQAKKTLIHSAMVSFPLIAGVLVAGGVLVNQQPAEAADVIVYKSPTCGCCSEWVTHLEKNGFNVEVHNRRNMNPIKAKYGVPPRLQSCHTAEVDGYVIEGHVPADDIVRFLREKPAVKGLAVPGMPMGSPGMEGPRSDPYDVLTFEDNGRTRTYSSRNQ
ncbi:MAG: DUF411 domain-containing protein [Candidatus Thiodiazotropha sp.]